MRNRIIVPRSAAAGGTAAPEKTPREAGAAGAVGLGGTGRNAAILFHFYTKLPLRAAREPEWRPPLLRAADDISYKTGMLARRSGRPPAGAAVPCGSLGPVAWNLLLSKWPRRALSLPPPLGSLAVLASLP